jgi:hypothetical protein
MTDEQKLKRDPAVILRRAMTQLRKRWDGALQMRIQELTWHFSAIVKFYLPR